jgi:hypothetical protein
MASTHHAKMLLTKSRKRCQRVGSGRAGAGAIWTRRLDNRTSCSLAAGTVKSFGAQVQAKGPGLKLLTIRYAPGLMGPRHVAEQENPHPYSNEPEVISSPSGLMIR